MDIEIVLFQIINRSKLLQRKPPPVAPPSGLSAEHCVDSTQYSLKNTIDVIRNSSYDVFMIKEFKCNDTEKLFNDINVKKFSAILRPARIKLEILNAAVSLNSLRVSPGNRLEQLKGDRTGQHSIRINNQWRICFTWRNEDTYDVEIVDYH